MNVKIHEKISVWQNFSDKIFVFFCAMIFTSASFANPVLNNVFAGNVAIQQTPGSTVINQSSQRAIINWRSFNIGQTESTHFQQPAGGIALNRISAAQGASTIFGKLTATGQIILINPAGIFFGPSSSVNVGGMIATTSNITDKNFLHGNYKFENLTQDQGSIINNGKIYAQQNGLVALIAPTVVNNGLIQANLGQVVLASGNAFTMNFDNNQLVNFTINKPSKGEGVTQTKKGRLIADGGKILVTAKTARHVLDNVINMEGVAQAKSVGVKNGEIIFGGDHERGVVRVAAKINVSGKGFHQKGGKVKIIGKRILVRAKTKIDASGDAGGGEILIGGNYHGQGPLPNALETIIETDTVLNADAINHGDGGTIIAWADHKTEAHGEITDRGGQEKGDGGFVETSGHDLDVSNIKVDLTAKNGKTGTWLLDPYDLTISNAVTNNVDIDLLCPGGTCTETAIATGANINTTDLGNNLDTANVILTTDGGGSEAGNITVVDPFSWSSANTLTLNANNNIFVNANINGLSGALTLNAQGGAITTDAAVNLNVANLNITQGTLSIAASNTISTSANLNLSNALGVGLQLNNFDQQVQSLAGGGTTGGNVSLGSARLTIGGSQTYAGEISGTGSIRIITGGAVTLSGANAYTGNTEIFAGTLKLGASNVIPDASAINIAVLAPSTFDLNNFNDTIGSLTGSNAATVSLGSGNLTVGDSTNTTFNGHITGTGGLTKQGSGTLTVSNSNTYTGATTINAGTLQLGASNVISDNSAIVLANVSGATFDLNNFNETIASLAGGGTTGGNVTLGSGVLTLGPTLAGASANTTFSGAITGSGGITKQSTGTFTLAGNNNSYSGTTTINNGTLQAGVANALSASSAMVLTNGQPGVLDLNNFDQTIGTLSGGLLGGTITLGSGTLTINNTSDSTWQGVISGTGGITKQGSGFLAMGGTQTYTGTTTINAGELRTINNNNVLNAKN